jgi:hypothetical protein
MVYLVVRESLPGDVFHLPQGGDNETEEPYLFEQHIRQ